MNDFGKTLDHSKVGQLFYQLAGFENAQKSSTKV